MTKIRNGQQFTQWMLNRERLILGGKMGQNPQRIRDAAERTLRKHGQQVEREIKAHARADPTDPFAALRARTHYQIGLANLGDYGSSAHP